MAGTQEREEKEVSLAKAFLSWKTLAAVVIAALIIYAFFHGFKHEERVKLWEYLHHVNPSVFALGFASYYFAYFFLGLRYKMLLDNCGVKITLRQAIVTCFMGAFTNAALPTKLGDFYRAYLLRKHAAVPWGQGLGANVGERILDLAFVFGSLFMMAELLFARGESAAVSGMIKGGSFVLGFLILFLILLLVPVTRRLIVAISPAKIRGFISGFVGGVTGSLRRNWLWLIIATAGLWAMESLRLYFVTVALGVNMTVPQVVFTVMATTLLASIPVSFSGLGFVEGGVTDLLKLFRIDAALGLATIICDRLISFVSVVVLGFISFLTVKGAS